MIQDSQRYEHCVKDSLDDEYIKCDLIIDTNKNKHNRYFILKTQNDNSFYSDMYISKLENLNLEIDRSPDVKVMTDDKIKKAPEILEHYDTNYYDKAYS